MTPAPISVERLRELLAKATPGPWSQDHRRGKDGGYRTQVFDASGSEIATLAWHPKPARHEDGRKIISTDRAENAELIVAMHEALPTLLHQLAEREAEVERLRAENLRVRGQRIAALVQRNEQREAKEAAERAREEARELLGACRVLMHRYGIDYRDLAWPPGDSLADRIAAFLAANDSRGQMGGRGE